MAVENEQAPAPAKVRDVRSADRAAGVNVAISVAAAVALLVVVNVIAALKPMNGWKYDLEARGRNALSPSAKLILDDVTQPVRLTTVYTSTRADRKPQQYLPRMEDLLEQMRRYKGNITLYSAAGDRDKADLVARLRGSLGASFAREGEFVDKFLALADTQAVEYDQWGKFWQAYPPEGWLSQFGVPKSIEAYCTPRGNNLRKFAARLRQDRDSADLPNYRELARRASAELTDMNDELTAHAKQAKNLAELPEKATAARETLSQAAQETSEAARALLAAFDKPVANENYVAYFQQTLPPADELLKALEKIARALADLVGQRFSQNGSYRTPDGNLLMLYLTVTEECETIAQQCQAIPNPKTPEARAAMPRMLQQIRQYVSGRIVAPAATAQAALGNFLDELTKVDPATQKLLAEFKTDDYPRGLRKPVADLLATDPAAVKDEALPEDTVGEQLKQDNVVVVEVGERVGVVTFDEVWPAKAGEQQRPGEGEEQRRNFNGDAAISAKILSLARPAFAEVVLTYIEPMMPGNPMMGGGPRPIPGPVPVSELTTLKASLQRANVTVSEWNLSQQKAPPPPDLKHPRPRVLLVLPPPDIPPFMMQQGGPTGWTAAEDKIIKDLVDAGTPAIFLTGNMPPAPFGMGAPAYALGNYLKADWGLEVKANYRLVQGVRSPTNPDQYDLPYVRQIFLPLSSFTEQAIGRPLRARRFYWYSMCPIVPKDPPAGVQTEDVLTVQDSDYWASTQAFELMDKLRTGEISGTKPDPDKDLLPPFALAVAARRTGAPGRIVVLGTSMSFRDDFLQQQLPRFTGSQNIVWDPPSTADVELLINSVYHLVDKDGYIPAGTTASQPLILKHPGVLVAVGVGWPLLVLALGGLVVLLRKR